MVLEMRDFQHALGKDSRFGTRYSNNMHVYEGEVLDFGDWHAYEGLEIFCGRQP